VCVYRVTPEINFVVFQADTKMRRAEGMGPKSRQLQQASVGAIVREEVLLCGAGCVGGFGGKGSVRNLIGG
jgi:hypothetical protein